jgi:hypothetical protein
VKLGGEDYLWSAPAEAATSEPTRDLGAKHTYRTAIGDTVEPLAPCSFSGWSMNANS